MFPSLYKFRKFQSLGNEYKSAHKNSIFVTVCFRIGCPEADGVARRGRTIHHNKVDVPERDVGTGTVSSQVVWMHIE